MQFIVILSALAAVLALPAPDYATAGQFCERSTSDIDLRKCDPKYVCKYFDPKDHSEGGICVGQLAQLGETCKVANGMDGGQPANRRQCDSKYICKLTNARMQTLGGKCVRKE